MNKVVHFDSLRTRHILLLALEVALEEAAEPGSPIPQWSTAAAARLANRLVVSPGLTLSLESQDEEAAAAKALKAVIETGGPHAIDAVKARDAIHAASREQEHTVPETDDVLSLEGVSPPPLAQAAWDNKESEVARLLISGERPDNEWRLKSGPSFLDALTSRGQGAIVALFQAAAGKPPSDEVKTKMSPEQFSRYVEVLRSAVRTTRPASSARPR